MLLFCTQAKLFITKGMVFNITFTVMFNVCMGMLLPIIRHLIQRDRERESICAAMFPSEGHGKMPGVSSYNSINKH